MSLPRIEELDLVFTYAQSSDNRTSNLLFTSLSGRTDIFQAEVIKRIADDPLYQKIMGKNSVLFPYETAPYPVLLATTEIMEQVASRMEIAKKGEAVVVCREDQPTETIDLHTVYYACQLPQKLILGCAACITSPTIARGCLIRQAAAQAISAVYKGADGVEPEDLVDLLKSRKSGIGDFIYISPLLTAHKHFAKTVRTIEEHDFSFVQERAAIREKIIDSRTRLNAVKKNICTHCCVKDECHSEFDSGYHRYRIRNCHGRYPETEEELVRLIVERHPPAMTFEQMSVLMANSGELRKRYDKCISYATFTQAGWNGDFAFGIVPRRRQRNTHICKSYDEAISILKDHNGFLHEVHKPVTPKMYALMVEAVTHPHSPASRSRWHVTSYSRLYISPTWREGVEIHYTYNSHSRKELPWSLEAQNFGVFVQHYNDLNTQGRLPYEETDLKLKQDRKSGRRP
jgi:hypothetical protein